MKEYLNLFIREKLKALGSEDRFMSKVRIFRHGSTAWIGVHPNKINIILENQPIEISVTADELDHIAYHCLKSAMEIRQDKTIYKQEKSCLHFKTYGPRTNCKQTFIPVKSSHLHCSDGCRAVYNQKQIREKKEKSTKKIQNNTKIGISINEFSKMLGVSLPHAYRLVKNKEVPSIKLGSKIVISKKYIEELLEGNQ